MEQSRPGNRLESISFQPVLAVIFDIDGTIVDSVELHMRAWKRAFEEFGKEVSYEQIRIQIGKGADDMLPTFFSVEDLGRFGQELKKYRSDIFRREYLPKIKAFPWVPELFERIKSENKKIALASTAKGEEINIYKELAGIGGLVDVVVCSDEIEESKPHRDICAVALKKLGHIAPDHVIAIGDTPYDAECARKMRVRAIGLLCGGGKREELQEAGCVAIYENPAQLLEQYEASPLGLG